MDIRSAQTLVSRELKDFGFWPTVYDFSFRAVKHVVPLTIWNAIVIDKARPEYVSLPEGYQARLLDAADMRPFAGPENDIEHFIIDQAEENGDRCMAIFDRGRLASYGWYSNQVTDLSEELQLSFDNGYVYMYKGFTHNDHRGKRLHAIGMTLALEAYQRTGFQGIVSVVESNNFSSLKSCYRMGYRDFGKIYSVKVGGRYRLHHSQGCRRYQLVIEPKPVATETRTAARVA